MKEHHVHTTVTASSSTITATATCTTSTQAKSIKVELSEIADWDAELAQNTLCVYCSAKRCEIRNSLRLLS